MEIRLSDAGQGPLVGLRVLELCTIVSGPLCGQILGDLGADVVKLESPAGDSTRRMGPPFRAGLTGMFAQFNRNKRSIALDLKRPEGRDVARRLAARSDVLLENFRPGVAERLALGYRSLAERNPGLVYVAINGFGSDGPYAEQPAYDSVIQGLSGFTRVQAEAGEPRLVRSIVADKSSGLTAAYATLAALFARERRGGRGQRIEVPMLDAYAAFMLPEAFSGGTFVPPDPGPVLQPGEVRRLWPTRDGHIVMMVIEDRQFEGICRVLERPDWLDDPRFRGLAQRVANGAELFALLEAELGRWSTAELVARARRHGVPLCAANGIDEFLTDPQVGHNRTLLETEHPEAGGLRVFRNPVRFGETRASYRRHPPRLGEHTDEILGEAGCTPDEIAQLRESGAAG